MVTTESAKFIRAFLIAFLVFVGVALLPLLQGSDGEADAAVCTDPYITFSSQSSFSVTVPAADKYSGTLEYSTDASNWTKVVKDTPCSSGEAEGVSHIYFRGLSNSVITGYDHLLEYAPKYAWKYEGTDTVECSGNIMTLLNWKSPALRIQGDGAFMFMFYGWDKLTSAPELPATTLYSSCYDTLFYGCSSLKEAPELPAMSLPYGCYKRMFEGCSSLTEAPELPALKMTSSRCYGEMFRNCTSLKEAPELPATSLTGSCYSEMFEGCIGIKEAPDLPATDIPGAAYFAMFRNCTNLEKAPEILPAGHVGEQGCDEMFKGCVKLKNAPELPATSLEQFAYYNMFYDCGCLTEAPELPAMTLPNCCYARMFYNCKNLVTVPELPATDIIRMCYKEMFYGCSKVRLTATGEGFQWKIPEDAVAGDSYWNYLMFYGTSSVGVIAPVIGKTYYQSTAIVRFNSNGGSSVGAQNVEYEDPYAEEPENPEKEGYVFLGWYKDKEFSGDKWDFSDKITGNMTLYAKWEEFSIDLRDGQGSQTAGRNSIEESVQKFEEENPVDYDRSFAGWAENIDETESDKIIATSDLKTDTTYHAVWKNEDTGKTIVTRSLDFTETESTDKTAEYGYKVETEEGTGTEIVLNGLTMFVLNEDESKSGIVVPENTTVKVVSGTENEISITYGETVLSASGKAVSASDTVPVSAVSSEGRLEVNQGGILRLSARGGTITYGINSSGEVDVTGASINVSSTSYGIYSTGDIKISDGASIMAADVKSKGIYVTTGNNITIDNAKVNVTSTGGTSTYGLHAIKGNVNIDGKNTVIRIIDCGRGMAAGTFAVRSAKPGSLHITGGNVNVQGAIAGLGANTEIRITGGNVRAEALGATNYDAEAICSFGTIDINNARVIAKCTDTALSTAKARYGIYAKGNVTVSAPKYLTAAGADRAFCLAPDSGGSADLISDISLTAFTDAGGTEGETVLTPAEDTGIVTLKDTYKHVKIGELTQIDFRNGEGMVDAETTEEINEALEEFAEEQTAYDKTFAGWAESIDETDESALVATENLEKGKKYYAVWKNADTGRTVITRQLDFSTAAEAADELSTYGYKFEPGETSVSGSADRLDLNGCTIDIYNVSGNIDAALILDSNSEISVENGNVIEIESDGKYAYGIFSGNSVNTDRIIIRKEAESGTLSIGAEALKSYGIYVKGDGNIALNCGGVTAKGTACALSKAPDFAGTVDAKASTDISGATVSDYEKENNSTYRWVKTYDESGVCSITKGGETVEYGTLPKAVKAAEENDTIRIIADTVTLKKNLTVAENKLFTMDLNGKTIDLDGHHIICKGQMTVEDSTENAEGVIKNGSPTAEETGDNNHGGAVAVCNDTKQAMFTLKSGTVKECSADAGGAVFIGEGAGFAMEGGKIINNTATKNGGGIYNSIGGNLRIEGGSVSGNKATDNYGGGVFSAGTMKLGHDRIIIMKNTGTDSAVGSNLTFADGATASADGVPAYGSRIGIMAVKKQDGETVYNLTESDVITDCGEGCSYRMLYSDDSKYELKKNDNRIIRLQLRPDPPEPTPTVKCNVTFDNKGHGDAVPVQTVEKGAKASEPDALTEEGYIFTGWFRETECINAWDFDNDTVTEDITLYAGWKEEKPQPAGPKEAFMVTGYAKKASNTISWSAADGADGYDVYYAKCGKTLKKVKTTAALKFTKKKLNRKCMYKYRVRAYENVNGEKQYIAATPLIHIAGVKAKYSNAVKVAAEPGEIHMEAGNTDSISAEILKKSGSRPVLWKHHVKSKIRYMSADMNVVTVDSKGNITAVADGTAYVYAYAASGAFAKVKVTVE